MNRALFNVNLKGPTPIRDGLSRDGLSLACISCRGVEQFGKNTGHREARPASMRRIRRRLADETELRKGECSEVVEVIQNLGAGEILGADEFAADDAAGVDDISLRRARGIKGVV